MSYLYYQSEILKFFNFGKVLSELTLCEEEEALHQVIEKKLSWLINFQHFCIIKFDNNKKKIFFDKALDHLSGEVKDQVVEYLQSIAIGSTQRESLVMNELSEESRKPIQNLFNSKDIKTVFYVKQSQGPGGEEKVKNIFFYATIEDAGFQKNEELLLNMASDCLIGSITRIEESQRRAKLSDELTLKNEMLNEQAKQLNKSLALQKSLQKEVVAKEKLAFLGSLSEGFLHELNNPLNIIINGAQMVRKVLTKRRDEDSREEYQDELSLLDSIVKQGIRSTQILDKILRQAKIDVEEPEVFSIKMALDEILGNSFGDLLIKNDFNDVEVEVDLDESLKIKMVKNDFERTILNLLDNSIHAFKVKSIDLKQKWIPQISINLTKEKKHYQLSLLDNGTGIIKKKTSKIFQPFFTTKVAGQGTGLGLAVVYDILNKYNIGINVESKEGKFTEVTLEIPHELVTES